MIQLSTMIISISVAVIFTQLAHPLSMGFFLMMQTVLICVLSSMLAQTFWFSYILFLVFLGGMLVLFIYVVSLASNEMFSFSLKMFTLWMFLIISMIIIFTYLSLISMPIELNNEMYMINNSESYTSENLISLNKLYNFPSNMITLLLVIYLLITLIAVVKVTDLFYGPLRKMM